MTAIPVLLKGVDDFRVMPMAEFCLQEEINPQKTLYGATAAGPHEKFAIECRDGHAATLMILSRSIAREFARKILKDTELLCSRCAMVDVSEGDYDGMCPECYGESCSEEEA
jgi:hypothetical protein